AVGVIYARDEHRATQCVSENVLVQMSRLRLEVVLGGEFRVAVVVVSRAVEGVSTALCLDKDLTGARHAVFGAVIVLENTNLCNRVDYGHDIDLEEGRRNGVIDAVNVISSFLDRSAIDDDSVQHGISVA